MRMESNYMFIYDKCIRVDLKAKNGIYLMKTDELTINMPASKEREFVFRYYQNKDTGEFSWWIQNGFDFELKMSQKRELIDMFLKDHPFVKYEKQIEFKDFPRYATDDEDIWIPSIYNNLHDSFYIDKRTEERFLKCLEAGPQYRWQRLLDCIRSHRLKYGLNYVKGRKQFDQDEALAECFLMQHGMSDRIYSYEEIQRDKDYGFKAGMLYLAIVLVCIGITIFIGNGPGKNLGEPLQVTLIILIFIVTFCTICRVFRGWKIPGVDAYTIKEDKWKI